MEMIIPMLNESITDIKIAFKVYLENRKAYILTFLIFFIGIFVLVFTGMFLMLFVILGNFFQLDAIIRMILAPFILLILISTFFMLLSYVRTIFGLSNDIMTSGELFTEFKRSITYFKKFWLYFTLLSLPYVLLIVIEQIFSLFALLNMINTGEGDRTFFVWIKLFVYLLDLTLYVTLIELFPSFIEVKNVKKSIKENFTIVRQNYKRLIYSISFYYLIFRGPMLFIDITRMLLTTNLETFLGFNIIFIFFTGLSGSVGLPILSLISTRIYNTTILQSRTETSVKSAGLT